MLQLCSRLDVIIQFCDNVWFLSVLLPLKSGDPIIKISNRFNIAIFFACLKPWPSWHIDYCVVFLCSIKSFVEIDGILYCHCSYILWFRVGKETRVFRNILMVKAIYRNTNNIRVLYWQKSRHWKLSFISCAWIDIENFNSNR